LNDGRLDFTFWENTTMMIGSTRAALKCLATACPLAIGAAVLSGSPAHADDNDSQIQEIVVTAQKRTENAKDVPLSISNISGDDLNARHIADFDDLTRSVPNVSFESHGTEGLSNIEIRGVSSEVGSAVVGVYLDETSITMQGIFVGQAQPIPFDLARVEVLRGPQGTLFGASSMGGAFRFITNQPKVDTYEVDVASDLSGTDHGGANYNESIVVNAPITPQLAVRVGVNYGSNSGWIDHIDYASGVRDATGINKVEQGVVKIGLLYKPSDDLTISPSLWMQKVDSKDSSVIYPDLGLYNTSKEVREPSNDRLFIPALKIEKHFAAADVTSVTSYFWRNNARVLDGTVWNDGALAYYFLDPNPAFSSHQSQNDSLIAHIPSPSYTSTKETQFTQELRAASSKPGAGDLPLRWTVGLYYSKEAQDSQNNEFSPGLNSAFQSIYGYPLSSTTVQNALGSTATTFADDVIYINPIKSTVDEYAGFGELGYDLLPTLHVSAGLRYEYSRQTYYATQLGFYSIGAITPFSSNSSASATTPKFSAIVDLSDTSTAYATIAKGYRLGGGTGPLPESLCAGDLKAIGISSAPSTYRSDSLWSYELGTKLLLNDRTLSIDVSTYLIEWKNIQQTVALPDCGFSFTDNFGDAQNYGAELQLTYKPGFVRNLTLGLNAGGGRSIITRSIDPSAAAVGQSTLFTPKWTATATADYKLNLTDGLTGLVRTDYDFTGMSHGTFNTTDPGYTNPSYGVLNGSIGIDTGSFQVSLYGKNLANNQTIIQRPNVASIVEGYTVRPLTIGLNVAKQFR
jgi:iron complex outermembrane receptor protein